MFLSGFRVYKNILRKKLRENVDFFLQIISQRKADPFIGPGCKLQTCPSPAWYVHWQRLGGAGLARSALAAEACRHFVVARGHDDDPGIQPCAASASGL
jgi:hypothetical protein